MSELRLCLVAVNWSFDADTTVTENHAPYTAAKHGVLGLTKAVAKEAAARGIRVNATSPGHCWTAMLENAANKIKEAGGEFPDVAAYTLQKRISQPHEQAHPILFLLSPWSSFIAGQNLSVDGGWVV